MADRGHEMTDDILNEIENRVRRTYETANIEVQEKLDDYLERFAAKDKKMREDVSAGKLSTQDYKDWRRNQMLTGKRWKALKDELAQDYVNADSIAREIAYRKMPDVYALNHDFATYQIEHDGKIDTSYTLYSRDAAYNLMEDDVNLLPYARTNSPKAKLLRERMDLIWNRQHINTAVTQGIIQGEPIHKIADRLQKVTDMDRAAALRNARTMVTSAQNKGRSDAYERLREKGVKIREKWIATLDGRTRHSHRHLHGTYKDPDTGLYANDLEYPGDPNGEPEEVYNCRCTETGEIEGFETETPKYSPKMGDMTFEEWREEKGRTEDVWWRNKPQEQTVIERPANEPDFMKKFNMFDHTPTQQEILDQVNPNYSEGTREWTHNCQRCVVAEEAMYRGYNVTTKAYNPKDSIKSSGVVCWEFDPGKPWYKDSQLAVIEKRSDFKNTVQKQFDKWGTDARAVIRVQWQQKYGGDGHFISASVDELGNIVYKNPQSGEIIDIDADRWLKRFSTGRNNMWIMRVDNREFTDKITEAFENVGE